jgi:hypothetical protein
MRFGSHLPNLTIPTRQFAILAPEPALHCSDIMPHKLRTIDLIQPQRPKTTSLEFKPGHLLQVQTEGNILKNLDPCTVFKSIIVSTLSAHCLPIADGIGRTMAGKHPIHIHPVRPLYRFAATGLGCSMWLFVSVLWKLFGSDC